MVGELCRKHAQKGIPRVNLTGSIGTQPGSGVRALLDQKYALGRHQVVAFRSGMGKLKEQFMVHVRKRDNRNSKEHKGDALGQKALRGTVNVPGFSRS